MNRCDWYLDAPVSNSGRLKTILLQTASERDWVFDVQIVPSPDQVLTASTEIIATADSVVLDGCRCWFNFAREVIDTSVRNAWLVDLSAAGS